MKTIIHTAIAAALVATVQLPLAQTAEARCSNTVVTTGVSKAYRKEAKAKRKAVANWKANARKQFGIRWNDIDRSYDRSRSCRSTGRQYVCTVRAKACPKERLAKRIVPKGEVTVTCGDGKKCN